MTLTNRYKTQESSHHSLLYSVVDTTKTAGPCSEGIYKMVCRCFEEGEALMIATALNNKGT